MEFEFLRWLGERLPSHPNLLLGPGDDAAILRMMRDDGCVVTSDMLNEGVDFIRQPGIWPLVGRKALAVNLSDLAAMAAEPLAIIVSLTLPSRDALSIAQQLYEGLLPLAEEFDVAVAGGDTGAWAGPLVISVTAIGRVSADGACLRSGARPGDVILVTGRFGGSILQRQFQFQPRVREALRLNAEYEIHAATDVSDGLTLDLWHISTASGCGAVVELERVPIADDAVLCAEQSGRTPLEHALGDGEDFELVLAVPPAEAKRLLDDQPLDVPLTAIGTFVATPGLWSKSIDGVLEPLAARGYEH